MIEIANLEEWTKEYFSDPENQKKAEKAYDAWISASDAYIEKRVEEYKNVNLSRAESSDVEAIQNAIDQVSGL